MDKLNLKQHNLLTKRREPFRFMLWLALFGSAMFFLLLFVIYLSRKSASDWVNFQLPRVFWLSTLVIMLSSLTLHLANRAFKREHFFTYRLQIASTLALGLGFIVMQLLGWSNLIGVGVKPDSNPAGAFLYLLSGLHIMHILGGLVFLTILFMEALRRISYVDSFVYSVNPPNQLRIRLVTTYWHFVDALWLLLFTFLLFQHS